MTIRRNGTDLQAAIDDPLGAGLVIGVKPQHRQVLDDKVTSGFRMLLQQ